MGKGTIKSHIGDGQYQVQLRLKRDNIEEQVSRIQSQISALDARIAGMNPGIEKSIAQLQRTAIQKRLDYLQNPENVSEDPTISAWCADRTEDLDGDVGTIEVPGERGAMNIQPGYEGNAVYSVDRDGQLEQSIAGTPEGVFYNLAMLPGWQKWKPTFRYGTITNLNGDVCDVILDSAISSQQNLSINQTDIILSVPIDYMSCNGAAFHDGDAVIVKFEGQDWSSPKVIGFKANPQYCGFFFKLTLEGVLVDDDPAWDLEFNCYDHEMNEKYISSPEYDESTGYWYFTITNPGDKPQGYWVTYKCEGSRTTQYQYKYLPESRWQVGDLIDFGTYEDALAPIVLYAFIYIADLCIVWNIKEDMMATDVPLDAGGFATFPCSWTEITNWLIYYTTVSVTNNINLQNSGFLLDAAIDNGVCGSGCCSTPYSNEETIETPGMPEDSYYDYWKRFHMTECTGTPPYDFHRDTDTYDQFDHYALNDENYYFLSGKLEKDENVAYVRAEHHYRSTQDIDFDEVGQPPGGGEEGYLEMVTHTVTNTSMDVKADTFHGELARASLNVDYERTYTTHAKMSIFYTPKGGWVSDYIRATIDSMADGGSTVIVKQSKNTILNILRWTYRISHRTYALDYYKDVSYPWAPEVTEVDETIVDDREDAILATLTFHEDAGSVNPFEDDLNVAFEDAIKGLIDARYDALGLGIKDIVDIDIQTYLLETV